LLKKTAAAWIEIAKSPSYARRLSTLGSLIESMTKKLFRRKRRPTMYSAPHEAIAQRKSHYVVPAQTIEELIAGLATVAARAGHGSDETATVHYGRPRRGATEVSRYPSPCADAAEVARVRQVLDVERAARRRNKDDLGLRKNL
jgi:hypothetical protein